MWSPTIRRHVIPKELLLSLGPHVACWDCVFSIDHSPLNFIGSSLIRTRGVGGQMSTEALWLFQFQAATMRSDEVMMWRYGSILSAARMPVCVSPLTPIYNAFMLFQYAACVTHAIERAASRPTNLGQHDEDPKDSFLICRSKRLNKPFLELVRNWFYRPYLFRIHNLSIELYYEALFFRSDQSYPDPTTLLWSFVIPCSCWESQFHLHALILPDHHHSGRHAVAQKFIVSDYVASNGYWSSN